MIFRFDNAVSIDTIINLTSLAVGLAGLYGVFKKTRNPRPELSKKPFSVYLLTYIKKSQYSARPFSKNHLSANLLAFLKKSPIQISGAFLKNAEDLAFATYICNFLKNPVDLTLFNYIR